MGLIGDESPTPKSPKPASDCMYVGIGLIGLTLFTSRRSRRESLGTSSASLR